MAPEVVKSPRQIGLCHPAAKGDYRVGIWLYDIRERKAEVRVLLCQPVLYDYALCGRRCPLSGKGGAGDAGEGDSDSE